MFTFTPLLGARSDSRASSSLLELDGGVKILVDVGWDSTFSTQSIFAIEKQASTLSFILLTHATTFHLGAYAHCCKHIPNFSLIPVYATSPVIAFGRTLLQDLYSSSPLAATFIPRSVDATTREDGRSHILRQPPTATEITKFFSTMTPLKYSQPHQPTASQFSAPLEGLTLTAYNSGHTLGGTIWHVQHGLESIVYAVDWNQARENVIAGASWFGGVGGSEVIEQLRKPTALVCSSTGATEVALSGGRKARDEALMAHIRSSLAKGGSVLIPTDSSARVLELAWLLEKVWHESGQDPLLSSAKIYLASKSANATLRHARSLLEWMDDSIVREFEGDDEAATRTHKRTGSKQANGQTTKPSRPFEFKHVKLVERQAQFEKALAGEGPRVILASDLSLDWGFSKNALLEVAQKSENLIILTDRFIKDDSSGPPAANSPHATLWQWYTDRQDGVALEKSASGENVEQVHTGGRPLSVINVEREPLDAMETQVYQQYVAARRQVESSLVSSKDAAIDVADDALDNDSSSSSEEESDDEYQGRALNVSTALGHGSRNKVMLNDEDLGVSILLRKKGVYDYDVREKKGRNAVFPYTHSRRRGDDFGDYIRPEDFLRPEEREEQEGQADLKSGNMAGQKRKWDDIWQMGDGNNKRQQLRTGNRGADSEKANADDGEDASESEESDGDDEVEAEDIVGPTKAVFSTIEITVNARLAFVDFAGIHDQRSLQMLIPLIGPKRLILTQGTESETDSLASDCRGLLQLNEDAQDDNSVSMLLTPSVGQTVDASVDTNAWIVKLGRDLVRRLQWQSVRNMDIATLSGQLQGSDLKSEMVLADRSKKPKLARELSEQPEKIDEDEKAAHTVEPVLDVVPTSIAASTRSMAQPIHVGDMRLADLRRLMSMAGHGAEFRGEGTLVIDGMVAVRKLGTGKIVVEGASVNINPLSRSDSFTQVRRKIYEGLAVVAAG